MTSAGFVIVGASLAGAIAAQTLREEGFTGRITLIGDEPHRPYERPPLSKGYLLGKTAREKVFVHPAGWYAEHDVDLRLGTAATRIYRDAHNVTLADKSLVPYDALLLATGSTPPTAPARRRAARRAIPAAIGRQRADQGRVHPAAKGCHHRCRLDRPRDSGRGQGERSGGHRPRVSASAS